MPQSEHPLDDIPDDDRSRVERLVEDFESLWRRGQTPSLDDFLPTERELRRAALVELVHADLEFRLKRGEAVRIEGYLRRYPELARDRSVLLALLTAEFAIRRRSEPNVAPAEYLRRFPRYKADLEAYLQATVVYPPRPVEAHPARTEPPTGPFSLAGYEVMEEIGRGGMGVVYKAKQKSLNRLVALKVLRTDQPVADTDLKRFRREAEAASRVLHPNVVLIYHTEQVDNNFVLVLEYVEGTDLGRLVSTGGPLPIARACDFIRQAALGLQHAHDHGLIHRDIKPTNLIVTAAPTAPHGLLKILDLGLARLHRPERRRAPVSTLTTEGAFLGTPDYIAPEQAKDPRKVDGRADVYSLGCTFYFLLTGRTPFPDAETVSEKLYHHWLMEPLPLTELRSEIPSTVAAVVQQMMAKRPEDRFQTGAELARTLDELGKPAAAGPRAKTPVTPKPAASPTRAREAAPVADLGTILFTCEGHLDWVQSVAFTPDGRRALSGSKDHSIRLWDLVSGREIRRFGKHTGSVRDVNVSPNGRYVVSAGEDRTVRVWDVDTGWEIRCFTGHGEMVTSADFLPDGLRIVSGSQDRTVRIWEVDGGQEAQRFIGHAGPINDLAVTPDGKRILSGSEDRTIRLWDVTSGHELERYGDRSRTGSGPVVTSLAISADGTRVLAGGSDHLVRLWELESAREVARFSGHTEWITSVAFSPDGRHALSASLDRKVRLWDVEHGRELLCLPADASCVAFSPDGTRALLGGADGQVRLWALPQARG